MARASQGIKRKVMIHKNRGGQKRPVLVKKTSGRTITISRNTKDYITISRQKLDYKGNTTFHKVVRIKKGR